MEICRHGCLDHCQLSGDHDVQDSHSSSLKHERYGPLERKDSGSHGASYDHLSLEPPAQPAKSDDYLIYEELIHDEEDVADRFPMVLSSTDTSSIDPEIQRPEPLNGPPQVS